MGLDWLAGNKPLPGHETEFAELLAQARADGISDQMRERFEAISVPAYSQLGAPVVGTDRIADAWVLFQVRNRGPVEDGDDQGDDQGGDDPDGGGDLEGDGEELIAPDLDDPASYTAASDEERQVLEEMKGYHVLELVDECDGLPIYTHGSISDQLDLTSFRGKFLDDCQEIIGEELYERAYGDQSPEEMVAYGGQLIEHARRHAAAHGCPEIEHQRVPPDDLDSAAGQAHILFAAGRWCVFWGSRGHFLDAWF